MDTRNDTQRAHLHPPTKKRGKTPEAKVSLQLDAYLKKIGAINIRTNAGSWQDENGKMIMGAKAGTSDKTCCLPGGIFCAVEAKSANGKLSEAQERYAARVRHLGGLYIVARSVSNLRVALVIYFGEDIVSRWEQKK